MLRLGLGRNPYIEAVLAGVVTYWLVTYVAALGPQEWIIVAILAAVIYLVSMEE